MVFELLPKNQLENKCNTTCRSTSLLKTKVKVSSFISSLFLITKKIPKLALKVFMELLDTSWVLFVIHFDIELRNYQKFKNMSILFLQKHKNLEL